MNETGDLETDQTARAGGVPFFEKLGDFFSARFATAADLVNDLVAGQARNTGKSRHSEWALDGFFTAKGLRQHFQLRGFAQEGPSERQWGALPALSATALRFAAMLALVKLLFALVLATATGSCNCGVDCTAQPLTFGGGTSSCGPNCCTGWVCGRDVYEVKCSEVAGGGQSCACVKNDVTTKSFDFIGWCSGDATKASANTHCGWSLL